MSAPEPMVPASPSTVGLTSDDAQILRTELRQVEARILTQVGAVQSAAVEAARVAHEHDTALAAYQHRLSDSILAVLRQVQVNEFQRAQATERSERHAKMTDERLAHLARASRRDHDTLSDVRTVVPEAEILPWFRRAWRPVMVLAAVLMFGSAVTACATVHLMGGPDTTDAGRTPAFTFDR